MSAAEDVKDAIEARMETAGVSRAELARRLGVGPPRVTRILDSDTPGMKLDLIERIAEALGLELQVRFVKRRRQR